TFLWGLLLPAALLGQATPSPLTMEAAVAYALDNSNTIKNARVQIADAEQQIKEQLSTGLPKINGTLDINHFLEVPVLPLPEAFAMDPDAPESIAFQLRNNFTAGISAQTMIFNGSFFVGLRAARAARKYYDTELENQQQTVRNQVINAYLPLLLIRENLEQLDKNITNLEALLQETTAFYEAGFVEQLDVDRLQLNLDNLQIERTNLERQQTNALRALKFTMNYPQGQELNIEDDLEELNFEAEEALLQGPIPYQQRAEVRVLDQALVLQDLQVELQRAAFLPTVNASLSGQYQFQGDKLSDGFWAPTVVLGINAVVPIYDFGGRRARVERAKLEKETALNQRDDLIRGIELSVINARTDFTSASERLEARLRSRNLAERIYETTQIKYREGVGSSLEVVQAEQELYTAQSNYLTALYETILSKESLKQALGR
ncbi:MAG: TolC family protein, partial [Bacteroidota bacterium]